MRSRHGLSQRMVASRLGISPSVVSGYESGERTPSVEILLALASMYRCSTDYLLGRENARSTDTVSVEGLTEKQIQLITELIETMR